MNETSDSKTSDTAPRNYHSTFECSHQSDERHGNRMLYENYLCVNV